MQEWLTICSTQNVDSILALPFMTTYLWYKEVYPQNQTAWSQKYLWDIYTYIRIKYIWFSNLLQFILHWQFICLFIDTRIKILRNVQCSLLENGLDKQMCLHEILLDKLFFDNNSNNKTVTSLCLVGKKFHSYDCISWRTQNDLVDNVNYT